MTHHWLAAKIWRYRVECLMVILGVTSLLMLVGTHLLQHSSTQGLYKGWSKMPVRPAQMPRPNNTYQNSKRSDAQTSGAPAKNDFIVYNMLKKKTHIPPVVFLKTHKTGSSTIQNLLFRKGEKDGATFAFPSSNYHFSYPDRFKAEFVDELPEGTSQFDILCSQMRLDVEELKRLMPSNTIYISILRDPVQTFESVFSYYTSSVPAFSRAKKAAETMVHRSALAMFLKSPESFWDPKDPDNGLGKNPMSFDFGLDSQHWDSSWPANLTVLEKTFHLVMIAEHFDESLVLLGAMLKLELEELAYVSLDIHSSHNVPPLDDAARARMRAWNSLDVLLYDFLLQVFWEKAERYGLERLNRDVALLRASTERIRRKCVARKEVPPGELEDLIRRWQTDSVTILGHHVQGNLTKQEQAFCMRFVMPELQYHSHLYFQQYGQAMRLLPTQ